MKKTAIYFPQARHLFRPPRGGKYLRPGASTLYIGISWNLLSAFKLAYNQHVWLKLPAFNFLSAPIQGLFQRTFRLCFIRKSLYMSNSLSKRDFPFLSKTGEKEK